MRFLADMAVLYLTLEVAIDRLIDWQAQQISHLVCSLRDFLNMDRPEHHSIDRLKERGVEKGSGRHCTLQGREQSVFNQTNISTVSMSTLGRLLRGGAERIWTFPSATMPSGAETETER